MDVATIYEIIGYVASALVAGSLLMTSILRLRLINLAGSIVFVVYGLLIASYPVALTNAIITVINLVQLWRLFKVEDDLRVLEISDDFAYLHEFLRYYNDDIRRIFPHFDPENFRPRQADLIFFVLRNMLPVGLFIAEQGDGQRASVQLDYVTPDYRDFKVGAFLFKDRADFFNQQGISELVTLPGNDEHNHYLRRMGFEPLDDGSGQLHLKL